mgnify:CR=1 FL=1
MIVLYLIALDFPIPGFPLSGYPTLDFPTPGYPSIPILSTLSKGEAAQPQERKGNGHTNMDAVRAYEEVIKDNIEYAYLVQDNNIDRGMLDESTVIRIRRLPYRERQGRCNSCQWCLVR